jgi:hypothetical protein
MALNIFKKENQCFKTLNGEIRAKFEKKSKSFWRNDKSTLVLIIDLG